MFHRDSEIKWLKVRWTISGHLNEDHDNVIKYIIHEVAETPQINCLLAEINQPDGIIGFWINEPLLEVRIDHDVVQVYDYTAEWTSKTFYLSHPSSLGDIMKNITEILEGIRKWQ